MNFQGFKIVSLCIVIIFFISSIFLSFDKTRIKAEFDKIDPIPVKMDVYYNGYKLGETTKVKISKNLKTTYLYITLNQSGLHLPRNISLKIKKYDEDIRYAEIEYPKRPELRYIKNGDVIKGEIAYTVEGFADVNQVHLDTLSAKAEKFFDSLTETTDSITNLVNLVTDIANENRENIYAMTTALRNGAQNFEYTSRNIEDLSYKLNESITKDVIEHSAYNIERTTYNFSDMSKGLITVSDNFGKTSSEFNVLVPKLSRLIDIVQSVFCNLNEIVAGLKTTLKQHFGTMRLFFGKPVK